ncbi:MAG: hypothetical protein IKW80_10900 [Thermoguttaceae bacterium]|nr:hypothetical protein [Thermoguttaceae bacterium]
MRKSHTTQRTIELLNSLPKFKFKWMARPDLDFGLGLYIRIFGLRTLETIKNHDFNKKAVLSHDLYQALCTHSGYTPGWSDVKSFYSDFFNFVEDLSAVPCPGQQSLETVMEENEPVPEPPKVEKSDPGAVLGDTPNNLKPPTLNFVDVFNKGTLPIEIDGKLYKPHLELIDVNSDQN